MADRSLEELQKEMAELTRDMQGLGGATKDATKGLDAFGSALAKGSKDIAQGLGGFTKSVGQGDTSFKSLNKIVDVASDAMAGLAKTVPYAGEAVAAGIKLAAEGAKFMLAQMDQSTKAFNDLGSVGALTADGMTGLQRQFTQSGLQLQSFTKLVADNSVALARFKGTAGEGAEIFSAAVGQLTQGGDDSLRLLGMNSDQIGATVGAFVTQQTRLGRSQNMDAKQLADGAKQYALELDKLQRVTGYSREQLQKQQDASLSESRFRANIDEMTANGQLQQVKELQAFDSRMSKFGPALGQGVRDLSSGSANTDAARRLVTSTNGAATGIMARLKAGDIDAAQAEVELRDAMKANAGAQRQVAKFTDGVSDAFVVWNETSDFLNSTTKDGAKKAATDQAAALAGSDQLTKDTIEAQKNIEKMNIEVQRLGFEFMPDAAKATKAVSTAMKDLVQYINKTIGKKEEEKTPEQKAKEKEVERKATVEKARAAGGEEAASTEEGRQTQEKGLEAKNARRNARKNGTPPSPAGPGTKQGGGSSEDIVEVVSLGDGFNVVTMGDGRTVKRSGARNWRNNNPGNLNAGKFAEGAGAIGQDTRFAIFPNLETGEKARESLMFGPSYSGLPLSAAINKYAPPGENDTAKYLNAVLKATGAAATDTVGQLDGTQRKALLDTMARVEGFKPGTVSPVSAASGAVLSGPQGGYEPNLTMHGTEAIVPIDTPAVPGAAPGTGPSNTEMMTIQLRKLEELADVFKSQLAVDRKLLQFSS